MISCDYCKVALELADMTSNQWTRAKEADTANRKPDLACLRCQGIVSDTKSHYDAKYEDRHRQLVAELDKERHAEVQSQIEPQRRGPGRPRKAQAA